MKEQKAFQVVPLVLFFALLFLVLLLPIKTPFNIYDEGFAVYNSERVLNGDIPYKDFWTIYPPGQFYVIAALFKIFGTNLLVSRLYDTLVRFAIVVCVYLLARKMSYRAGPALYACTMVSLLLGLAGSYNYAVFPALALCLLAILILIGYVASGKQSCLLLTGVLLGIAIFFRWDIGLFAIASIISTVIFLVIFPETPECRNLIKELFSLRQLALSLVAMIMVVLFGYGWIVLHSGFDNLWNQMIIVPATLFSDDRKLPFPSIVPSVSELNSWIQFYVPLFLYALIAILYLVAVRVSKTPFTTKIGLLSITSYGLYLFLQGARGFDTIHIVPTTLVLFLVGAFYIHSSLINISPRYFVKIPLYLLTALYLLSSLANLFIPASKYPFWKCNSFLERAGCIYVKEDQEQSIKYLKSRNVNENKTIFVGNHRHDINFANDVGFYFLSEMRSATYFHDLYMSFALQQTVQITIIHEIEANKVDMIVLYKSKFPITNNPSEISDGGQLLDKYINENYTSVATFGDYEILKRYNP